MSADTSNDDSIIAERIRVAKLLVRWRRLVGPGKPLPMTSDAQLDLDAIERALAEANT